MQSTQDHGEPDRAGLRGLAAPWRRRQQASRAITLISRTPANRSSSGIVRVDQRPDQFEVLGRPHLALQVERHREEPAVRVDLGGVREQRGVAPLEPVGDRHPGGDLRRRGACPSHSSRRSRHSSNGDSRPCVEHRLVQRLDALVAEADVVVELQRLPRLARRRGTRRGRRPRRRRRREISWQRMWSGCG